MSDSRSSPCRSCGSELSAYAKNPRTGHPCPFCGYIGISSLPVPVQQWFEKNMATVHDVDSSRIVEDELMTFIDKHQYDAKTKFLARLAFEEAKVAIIRRNLDG